jgi:sigma-E factor negative regulatory protein RseC
MIEAQATVLRLDADVALVANDGDPVCGRCVSVGGCKALTFSWLLCVTPREYRVANLIGALPGDKVTVGVPAGLLRKSAAVVYLVPLLLVVVGVLIGRVVAPADASIGVYAMVGFLTALPISGVWITMVNRGGVYSHAWPVILRASE